MVFQSYALFPHLTVAENILFGLRVRKVPAAERARRLARVAALLGLEHAAGAQAVAIVRRPAAARRARPRHHRRDAGLSDGRAAVQSRRPVARRDAARDPRAAAEARHHHGLCHPRPDRSHEHGRPGHSDARRQGRAGGAARRALRAAGNDVRRALHRHAADEHLRSTPDRGDRRSLGIRARAGMCIGSARTGIMPVRGFRSVGISRRRHASSPARIGNQIADRARARQGRACRRRRDPCRLARRARALSSMPQAAARRDDISAPARRRHDQTRAKVLA